MPTNARCASKKSANENTTVANMSFAAPQGLQGLTDAEAAARRTISGENTVSPRRVTMLWVLIRQFASPFDALLLGVAILSIVLHQATDAAIILAIVAISVVLGTRNEYRAERIIEGLKARLSRKATVIRSGAVSRIDAADLVPGDVVVLTLGDAVPADLNVRVSKGLECDESVLTGESRTVEKTAGSDAYMGTSVFAGSGYGIVVSVGKDTRFGEIAERAAHRPPPTTFEIGLRQFSLLLLYITLVISVAVLVVSMALHRSLAEALLFALAISVSLTPQMLPVIVSVSLSLGAYRMAKMGAVVKRLISIEDIGNVAVLFTDKTGTLTTGVLAFERALDPSGTLAEEVHLYGLLCNSAGSGGDPTAAVNALDLSLWRGAPPSVSERARSATVFGTLAFDYERRLMSAVVQIGDERLLICKGAPESVLARCSEVAPAAQAQIERYADEGARLIAVGIRAFEEAREPVADDERNLQYAGLLVFSDPPKEDAAESISRLEKLNVRVKVITGDNARAALALCGRVGLNVAGSLTGDELDRLDDGELERRLDAVDLFARISPLQKERIIRVQRKAGADVGFLGDGINDVLALKAADVGITVDSAADVAKDASDVVLLSKDLDILAHGVAEGRRIFVNTIKYILMATSSNFGNMISTAVGAMILPFLPLLPSQVLLNNLLYDTSEMTIPSDRVDEELLVRPSRWNLGFVQRFMLVFGPFSAISDFAMFAFLLEVVRAQPPAFRSGFFIETFGTQALMVFVLRTHRVPFFRSMPSLQLAVTTLLCAAIGMSLPFTPLAHLLGFAPVPTSIVMVVLAIVVLYAAAVEFTKYLFFRSDRRLGASLFEATNQ